MKNTTDQLPGKLKPGKLLAVFESVQVEPPHPNCIRSVASADGGSTWSWEREERAMVFQPSKRDHMAVSPWLSVVRPGTLICAFATDEDREIPDKPATHPVRMNMDIKYVLSLDNGRTWDIPAQTIFDRSHRNYAPGVLLLKDGSLLATFMDFSGRGSIAMRGRIRQKRIKPTVPFAPARIPVRN